jgi:Uma2 family endonuclease
MNVRSDQLLTEDDLLRLPQDHMRHELVRGQLRTMPLCDGEHGAVVINVTVPLAQYVDEHHLGRVFAAGTGFTTAKGPDTVRAPDGAFVAAARIAGVGIGEEFFRGPPDLAVEVDSASDTMDEVDETVEDWLEAGVSLVWVVDPTPRRVTVHAKKQTRRILGESDVLGGGNVVPGFTLPIREIFA